MRPNNILFANPAPRAVHFPPRAEQSPVQLLTEVTKAFNEFKTSQSARLDALEADANDVARTLAVAKLNGGIGHRADDPEYTTAFASYFRKGASEEQVREANAQGERAKIHAAMSVGDQSSGGYLAPTEWDRTVNKAKRALSPMRRLATVQSTSVNAYTKLWNNDQWGSGWVGETASRPQTTNASLSPVTFGAGEIYAMPAVTQRLLDDSQLDLEAWLANEVAETFSRQEGIAFISGDGVNKPFGLLTYVTGGAAAAQHPGGVLDTVASGHASTIPNPDVLIDFAYALDAPYRQNSTWLMNSATAATIRKFKNSQGDYIWSEGIMADQPPLLLGRPVEFDEGMPNIGAGNLPIAFGDFRAGYLINDRTGIRVLRDPFTNKPYVLFYTTKRVGGGVQDPRAIRLLKVAAS